MVDETQTRPRGRPMKMDRNDVLDLAMNAYWHEGPRNVSINALCQRADISKPSLYREFENEDGLMAAALERYAEEVLAQAETILNGEGDFAARLQAVVDYICDGSQFQTGCLFVKTRQERAHLGEKSRAKLAQIESAALQIYTAFFANAQSEGTWQSTLSPDIAAQYLHAQLGLALSQRAEGIAAPKVKSTLELALSVL